MRAQRPHLHIIADPSRAVTVEESCTLDMCWLLSSGLPIDLPLWNLIDWRADWSNRPLASAWCRFLVDGVNEPILEISFLGSASSLPNRLRQNVTLSTSLTPKGGVRWWLVCPKCHGNRAKLHLPMHGDSFLCRSCHSLTYRSCQESHRWDTMYARIAGEQGVSLQAVKQSLEGWAKSC
jgi:hypothetical protein